MNCLALNDTKHFLRLISSWFHFDALLSLPTSSHFQRIYYHFALRLLYPVPVALLSYFNSVSVSWWTQSDRPGHEWKPLQCLLLLLCAFSVTGTHWKLSFAVNSLSRRHSLATVYYFMSVKPPIQFHCRLLYGCRSTSKGRARTDGVLVSRCRDKVGWSKQGGCDYPGA
jgi:hypothetical protein